MCTISFQKPLQAGPPAHHSGGVVSGEEGGRMRNEGGQGYKQAKE